MKEAIDVIQKFITAQATYSQLLLDDLIEHTLAKGDVDDDDIFEKPKAKKKTKKKSTVKK